MRDVLVAGAAGQADRRMPLRQQVFHDQADAACQVANTFGRERPARLRTILVAGTDEFDRAHQSRPGSRRKDLDFDVVRKHRRYD